MPRRSNFFSPTIRNQHKAHRFGSILKFGIPAFVLASIFSLGAIDDEALANSACTGQTISGQRTATVSGTTCVIRFTSNSSWTVPANLTSIQILVVGGGGGGGADGGSGGGGGEVRQSATQAVNAEQTATVSIGSGGQGGSWLGGRPAQSNGVATTVSGAGLSYQANGGTLGGGWTTTTGGAGGTGGSGGSGSQGGRGGGGPGGCSPVGVLHFGAVGSAGPSSSIGTASATNYGGGGGGGLGAETNNTGNAAYGAAGGAGGGGRGSDYRIREGGSYVDGATAGYNGAANTGGGGGAGSACNAHGNMNLGYDGYSQRTDGGNGGSGVVLISYTMTAPTAPTSVTAASNQNAQSAISWGASTSNGGAVTYSVTSSPSVPAPADCTNTSNTSCTFTGLTNGTQYTFTITPSNAIGAGPGATATATPRTVPGAPTNLVATSTGQTTATVAFTAPASNGGSTITTYTVTTNPVGGSGSISQAGSGTISVTGLTSNTAYTFTIKATNSLGTSSASSSSNLITTDPILITFDANGGTGSMNQQIVPQGVATALSENVFTRDGYVFGGWNSAANGTGALSHSDQANVTRSADLTLYAMWTSLEDRAWAASAQQDIFTATTPIPTATNAAFTAEAWIYPTVGTNTWRNVFGSGTASDNETQRFFVGLNNSNQMYLSVGRAVETSFDTNIKFNEWTHIAIAVSGSTTPTIDVYVNGRLLRQFVNAAGRQVIGSYFTIGSNPVFNYNWTGEIDQVKVWQNYLNVNQVVESMHVYQKGSLTAGSTLRAHYDFNEYNSGVLINRAGGSSYDMTMSNSVNEDRFSSSRIIETGTAHSLQNFVKFNRSYLTAAGGWTPPANVTNFKALVVGGGGAGGSGSASDHAGGGGGGGQVLSIPKVSVSSAVAVKVGQGGLTPNSQGKRGSIGGETALGSNVALGGGGGGGYSETPTSSWTGGGGAAVWSGDFTPRNGATPSAGRGFKGGNGLDRPAGGGGGSGGPGLNHNDATSPAGGGLGLQSSIAGDQIVYGSGGGGGTSLSSGAGGSSSGPGAGGGAGLAVGTAGAVGTGSGGGGGSGAGDANWRMGGSGGSGVVILSYGTMLEVTQTSSVTRKGSAFSGDIKVQLTDTDGTTPLTTSGVVLTLTAPTANVLTSSGSNVSSANATTDSSGIATFTGLGLQDHSDVTGTLTFTVTSDAYVGTTFDVTPTFTASTVNITSSGSTDGAFVGGKFESNTSGTANILNSDLVTAMGSGTVLVESTGAINVQADVESSTSGAGLTLKAVTDVLVSDGIQITTNSGHVVFWSRSASTNTQGSQTGEGRIRIGNGVTVSTSGGAIILAGSSSEDANGFPNGAAYVNATSVDSRNFAIHLGTNSSTGSDVNLLSAGGQIRIYGETGSSGKQAFAGNIGSSNSIVVNSGTGTQDWRFVSANDADNVYEVWGGNLVAISAAPYSASTPAINVYIRSTSATSTITPIQQGSNKTNKFIVTGTGDLNFEATSARDATYPVDKSEGLQFLANGGAINLNFGANGLDLSTASASNPIIVGAVSGNNTTSRVSITSDRFNSGTATAGIVVRTSGQVSVAPAATSFSADANFNSTWSFVGNGGLTLGKTGNTRAVTVSGNNSVAGNLNIIGGNLSVTAAQTTTNGGNITITPSGTYAGAGALTSAGTLTISGGSTVGPQGTIQTVGNATFSGSGNFTNSGAAITSSTGNVQVTTTGSAAGVVTGNVQATLGSIAFNTGGAYSGAGTLTAGTTVSVTTSSTVTVGGAVLAGDDVTYTSGSLIQNANVTSSNGNVSMTSSGASASYTKNSASSISAAQEVSISSAASTVNNTGTGTISAGTVRLESSGNMTSGAPITSRGDVEIRSTAGNATVSGPVNAAGNTTVVGSAVAVNAAVTTTPSGNVSIEPRGAYTGTGAVTSAGTLSISGGTTITPTGNFQAAGDITLLGTGQALIVGRTINSTNGAIAITAGPTAATAIDLQTSTITSGSQAINLSGTSSGADPGVRIRLSSAVQTTSGDINITGIGTSGWGAFFDAANILSTSGDISVDGGVRGIVTGHLATTNFGAISGTTASGDITVLGDAHWDSSTRSNYTTTGHVVLNSKASNYRAAPTYNNHTFTGAASVTIGSLNAAHMLTVDADGTIAGPFNVLAQYVYLNSGTAVVSELAAAAGSTRNIGVLVKATDRIYAHTSASFETDGSDIVFWSDADNDGVGAQYFKGSNVLKSNGGKITLAGGLDDGGALNEEFVGRTAGDGHPDNYAAGIVGWGSAAGIEFLDGHQLLSGGGDIFIAGRGSAAANDDDMGVAFRGGLTYSGTGKIAVYGKSPASCTNSWHRGIFTGYGASTHIISEATAEDAIYLHGDTSSCNSGGSVYASAVQGYTAYTHVATPNGGGINIYGTQGNASYQSGAWNVDNQESNILQLNYFNLVSNSGPITARAVKATTSSPWQLRFATRGSSVRSFVGQIGSPVSTGFTSYPTIASVPSTSNVTLQADSIVPIITTIDTTGHLSFVPETTFETANTMFFSSDWALLIPKKVASFTLGEAASGGNSQTTANLDLLAISSAGPVNVYGGTITYEGNISSDEDVNLLGTGSMTVGVQVSAGDAAVIQSSSGDLNINSNSSAGAGGTLFKASRDVLVNSTAKTISTTGGGDIVFWANTSGTGGEVDTGGLNVTINSNGGDIVIGGGADDGANGGVANDGVPDNYLLGRTVATLASTARLRAPMTSGAGDIVVRAQHFSGNSGSALAAVYLAPSVQLSATSGNILLEGIQNSGNVSTANQYGVYLGNSTSLASRAAVTSDSGNVTINGDASQSDQSNRRGIVLYGVAISAGGDISLTGASPGSTGSFDIIGWAASTLTASGNILVSGARTSGLEYTTLNSGGVTTLTVGRLTGGDLGTGATSASVATSFTGSGSVVIEPFETSFINEQTMADVTIASTITGLTIGKSGNDAAVTIPSLSAYSIAGDINLIGGAVTVNGNQTTTSSGNITITPSGTYGGSGILTSAGSLTISGGTTLAPRAAISAAGDIAISGSSSFNNSSAPITSSSGSVSIASTNSYASIQAAVTSTLENVSITVERTVISAAVTASQGVVAIQPSTTNRNIKITSVRDDTVLSILPAELERIEADTLRLTNSGTGNISFDVGATLTGKVNNLAIRAGQDVTAGSGVVVVVANLGIEAGGDIDWPGTGGDASVVALNASSVTFNQSANYEVAAVDGIDPEFGLGVKFVMEGVDRTNTVDRFMAVTFNPPPVVKIQDKFGKVLASNNDSAAGYTVAAAMTVTGSSNGTPTLAGNTTTRSGGTHTYTNLRVIDGTGAVSISFTVTRDSDSFSLVDAESSATPQATAVVINYLVKAGFPSSIVVSMGASTLAGKTGLSPTATLKDSSGGTLASGESASAIVTVTVSTDTQRIQIESGGSAQASSGVASFPSLVVGGLIGSNYVLTFSVQYLDANDVTQTVTRDSDVFSVQAGDATALAVDISSQTVASRADLNDISVTVVDAYGNPAAFGTPTAIGLTVGTGANLSPAAEPTGYSGPVNTLSNTSVATFSGLSLAGKVESYDLTFSSGDLTPVVHTVELTHGVATNIEITGPTNAANDKDFTAPVVVSIFDADANLVTTGPQSTQNIELSSATTLTGTREISATAGRATFTALRLIGLEGTKSIQARVLSPSTITNTLSVELGFGDATKLVLTTQAAGIANRTTFVTDPVITVQDSSGNTVTNYSVDIDVTEAAVGGVNGSLFGDVDVAPSSGVATFTDLELRGEVGQYDLTFTSGSLTATTQRVTLNHGAAFDVVVSGSSEADNATDFGSNVSVVLRDQDQNIVTSGPDSSRSVVASNTDADTLLSGTTTVTASAGRATFTSLRLTGPVGAKTVALTWGTSPTLAANLSVGLSHGVATQLVLTQDAATAASRAVFGTQPVVSVRDVSGNPVSDFVGRVTVDVSRAGTSVPFALTGATGVGLSGSPTATFSGVGLYGEVGTYTLTYSSTNLASATQTIALGHGVATQLDLTTPAAGFVNRVAFATQPSITVRDQDGNWVSNYATNIEVTSAPVDGNANAEISGTLSRTPSSGIATFTNLRLDGKVGQHDLTFSSGNLAVATQRVSLTHGVATAVVLTGATTAANDRTFGSAVVVEIQDADANRVTTGASADQALTVSAVSADLSELTLAGNTGLTVAAGIATLSNLKLTGTLGTKTLTATVSTPSLSGTRDIDLGHGYATKLVITQAASEAVSREAFNVQPIITVQDISGNPVSDFAGEVSAEVFRAGTAIPYALTGTITRTVSGSATATFTNLGLFGQVGTYSITYLAVDDRTGLSLSTVGQSISLAHGSATQVEVAAASTVANAAPLGDVTATIRDQDGNPVTTGTPEVVLTVSGSTTVSLVGAAPSNAANGVATFSGVSILGLEEQKVLTATVASLSNLSGSANVDLTFGAGTQLALVSGVTEAVNRQPFASSTVIEARDSSGNPVDTFSGDVSVSATSGSGVVTGTLTKTATSSPRVSFSDLEFEGDVDSYVLTYTSTGLANITQAVELTHGAAHSLLLQMTTTAKNNQDIPDVVVRVLDEDLNLVTFGTPQITLSGSDLTGTLVRNASGGIATFTTLRFVGDVATAKYVTATLASPSITSNQVTVTLSHGVANQMVLTTSAAGAVNRGGFSQVPVVTLRDISGNPVLDSNATVTVSETSVGSAAADISGTVSRTPVNGVVIFTGLGLNGQVGQYTLTFSTTGLTDITQSITLTHGVAVKLEIASSADTARSGIDFVSQPVVHVLDFDNNLVTTGGGSSVTVTAALFGANPSEITLFGESGLKQVQASGGVATFTTLRLTGDVGSYSLDYTSGALTKATQQIELLAGLPASLSILVGTGPVNAIAGEGFAQAIEVELLDAQGNRVLSDSLSDITATLVASSDVSSRGVTATTVRATNGVASFAAGSALNYTLAGDHKISFSDGTRTEVSDSFTITHAAASKLEIQTQPASLRNDLAVSDGFGVAPALRVLDAFDNPVVSGPTITVTATVTGANSGNITSVSGGSVATNSGTELVSMPNIKLRGLAGNYVLNFAATGSLTTFDIDSSSVSLTFGLPSQLVLTQTADVARSGAAFTPQPVVEVRDNSNNLVSDSQLVVTADVTGREMVGTTAQTASGGIATFSGLGVRGVAAEGVVLSFAANYLGTPLATSQTIDVTAGDAVKFEIIEQPQTVKTRSTFTTSTALRLLDASDNPVPTDNSTFVSIALLKGELTKAPAVATGGGPVTLTSARATEGVVRFVGLTLPVAPANDYYLEYNLGAFSLQSQQFAVQPGPVATIDINIEPSSATGSGPVATGELLPVQPEVTLYDVDGYVSAGASGTVSVAISSGADGNLTEGLTTTTVTDGVARFAGVRLVGTPSQQGVAAVDYRLRFSFTNDLGNVIESADSQVLNVTNTRASKLSVSRGAANGRAGSDFNTQPIVHLLDRYDNIVETGVDRNLEIIASAPGADQLNDNAINALNGVATFEDLSLGGQVDTNYTLNFVVANRGDITSASQSNVQVTFGSQAKIRMVTQPESLDGSDLTKSGQVLPVQPVVEILDAFNNRVTDSTRQISVTLMREGVALDARDRAEATVATPSNGVATFSGVKVIGRPGDTYKLVLSGDGFSNITSQGLVVRHGDPTSLEFVNQPVSLSGGVLTRTGALLPGQPKLRLLDFDGNVATEINSDSVSAFVSRGGGYTVLEVSGVEKNTGSFVNGEATFENLMVVATPGVEQFLGFETVVRGLTLQSPESAAISFQNAEAHQLAITTQACAGQVADDLCQPGITGDGLSVNPVIEIQDEFGNRAVDFNGVITVTTTNNRGQLSDLDLISVNEITVTAIAGVATFEDLNLVAIPGEQVELLFTSAGLTSVTGAPITVRAAAAVSIAVATQPVGARTGSALAIAPVAELRDRFGNLAASDDVSRITVTASAGTLVGTTTVTATAGRATFSDLSFTGIPGMVFTLTFTGIDGAGASLTGISSSGFTVKNAIADTLVITQQPTANRTGDLLNEIVLQLRDFDDNLAEDDSSTVVRVEIHGGDGNAYFVDGSDTLETYSNTSTILRQAASGGVVRFSNLRVVGTPGISYQLIFTANPDDVNAAYDSLPSSALVFTHAEPSALEVTAWPVANLTDEPLTTQPALRLLDRYGNLATLDNQTVVSASVFGATGSVIRSGESATSVAGIVTFDGLTVDGTPGELYQLRFTSGVITVDENLGFRLKKNADIAMSFVAVNFSPSATVTRDLSITLTDSPGTPSYSTVTSASICTVNSSTGVVTVNGVGDCMVRVTIPDTTYYIGGSLNALLVINKAQQATLSMSSASTVSYLSTLSLAASGGSGTGRLIFSTSGDCRAVSGILITANAGSDCLVRVDKLGDDNYVGQVSSFQAITVTKLNQELLQVGNPREVSVGDVNLFTHGGSGTGAVSYEVVSINNDALCSIIDGNVLRAGADGDCYVIATKAASTNYNEAPSPSKRFTFSKAKQNVVFTSTVPQLPLAGGELYQPVATATSGLAVTYAITAGSGTVCEFDSVETSKIKFLTSGNCEVTATQAGNAQYVIATARQVIAVGLRNQTVTFPAVENRRFGQPAFMLAATASSGLAVSYQLDSNVSPQACSVTTAGLVSITQAGTCSIKASQAGNASFQAAPDVFRSFTVAPDRAGAPHLVSVSASDQTITATFTAPSYLGGSTISRYVMEVSMVGTDNVFINFACQANPLVPCRLAGLPNANGESYTVRVAAVTAAGVGAYSRSSDPLSTAIANAAVSKLTASSTSSTLSLVWEAPIAIPGTFESYDVYVWPMNDSSVPSTPTLEVTDASQLNAQISITVPSGGFQSFRTSAPSVIRSDGYNIKVVTITNTLSAALPENTSMGMKLGATTPGSPSAVALTDLTEKVIVGWSAPTFDGGHAILGYQVMVNGAVSCVLEAAASSQQVCRDSDQRVFELAEIEVGVSYQIEIAAVNELGIGAMANVTHLIPAPVVAGGSSGTLPETMIPGRPSKPAKPNTGIDGPDVFDRDSWKPGVPGSGTDSEVAEPTEPLEPSEPSGSSDGSDTSASGAETDEANLSWLMLLIGLAMFLVLLRVGIRGRKRRSLS